MKLSERYRKPSDLPGQIPVFPLKGAILLPRTMLPLHVFEPRYLAMMDAVIAGERLLGIVQPEGDGGETGSPAGKESRLKRVGCVGRLTSFQEQDDGRLIISLTGIIRFEMADELESEAPYRMCRVGYERFGADLDAGLGEIDVDRERLLEVLKAYLDSRKMRGDWDSIRRSSTEFLINSLSVISPYGPEEKQALLEAKGLKERAEILVALAEMEMASNSSSDSGPRLQ